MVLIQEEKAECTVMLLHLGITQSVIFNPDTMRYLKTISLSSSLQSSVSETEYSSIGRKASCLRKQTGMVEH